MPVCFSSLGQQAGKLDRRSLMAAGKNSFFIRDRNSGQQYLVDTGAQLSVIPATESDRRGRRGEGLKAANQTDIFTYGKRTIMLRFGETRFEHEFVIADVPHRMLGIDFTDANGISIDSLNRELFYRESNVTICAVAASDGMVAASGGRVAASDNKIAASDKPEKRGEPELFELLESFPSILNPDFKNPENKHRIEHYIKTDGHPVFSRPRRLDQSKLEAAKAEFAELERLGIIRRSESPWASPLHVVPKANGKLRPCGDYRRLNEMTKDDKYPLPHIHDFNARLLGAKVFSKVCLLYTSPSPRDKRQSRMPSSA